MNPDFSKPRKTLWWVRSLAEDVDHYRVDQSIDGGVWHELTTLRVIDNQWDYQHTTAPLTDLATYIWRIVPVDTAGTDGTPIEIGPEKVVRTPDAPDFTINFDPATRRITFSAA